MTQYPQIDHPRSLALLFPRLNSSASICPENAEDISFELSGDVALHCRYYFSSADAPIIYFYPASSEPQSAFDKMAQDYQRHGMNVFLVSYRGCWQNEGSPTVGAMYEDSRQLFPLAADWLKTRGSNGPIFVMGQSLGSICAIDTVFNNPDLIKGMVIESGICGTASYLKAMGLSLDLAAFSEIEGFDNLKKIEKIKNPTLIFQGARDSLVAIKEAEELQASSGARTKQFFVIPGAEHHTVSSTGGELYLQTIKQFTDTVCGINTWRQKRRKHKNKQQGDKR